MERVEYKHNPVLLTEVIEFLNIDPQGIYVDATFGRGGHASAILQRLNEAGRLIVIDKDPEAIKKAHELFPGDPRVTFLHGSFTELEALLENTLLVGKIAGILFDLGVSSPQLDDPLRGFSFLREGPLDMRMNTTQGISAASWIASVAEETLADILWTYGEERHSRRIAKAIVTKRKELPILTTHQLADIIATAHPAWQKGKHPATQSFQAIRIFINDELNELKKSLRLSVKALKKGGRLLVISFHSLEDRIVKQFMQNEEQGEKLPSKLPIKYSAYQPSFKRVSRAIKASMGEIHRNSRARSAVLRVGEKQL